MPQHAGHRDLSVPVHPVCRFAAGTLVVLAGGALIAYKVVYAAPRTWHAKRGLAHVGYEAVTDTYGTDEFHDAHGPGSLQHSSSASSWNVHWDDGEWDDAERGASKNRSAQQLRLHNQPGTQETG